jgi:hypothetical protein
VRQGGKARPGDDFGPWDKRFDHRLQRCRTEDHGFLAAARMQQPVGEDMAALPVSAELGFVDPDKRQIRPDRHRFGSAQQPARVFRLDPFLAGDQRDAVLTLDRANPVVNLARKQAKRKADRARGMGAHPLDREVGLAGIGGTQHGLYPAIGAGSGKDSRSCGHRRANLALPAVRFKACGSIPTVML